MLYNLDEICLIPTKVTTIKSRKECVPLYNSTSGNYKLPIYISPMSSVLDEDNIQLFEQGHYNTIVPRSVELNKRIEMLNKDIVVAFGFKEASYLYDYFDDILSRKMSKLGYTAHICIDQANGHMEELINLCKDFKKLLGKEIWIMTGNIANPITYYEYAKAGIDAVRIGIGTGNVCTTSIQTGIHYPMATLITEIYAAKKYVKESLGIDIESLNKAVIHQDIIETIKATKNEYKSIPLIIADGGFTNISQIIKALALGADYVMIGRLAASMKEACGEIAYDNEKGLCRKYYGMSTYKAQSEISKGNTLKHEEGIEKLVRIETSIDQFRQNFCDVISSTMSYTGHRTLEDFIGNVEYNVMNLKTLNKI